MGSTTRFINGKRVLFQNIGGTWYLFTEIEQDVFYSSLPQGIDPRSTKLELYHILEAHMESVAGIERKKNRSAESAA